MLILDIHRLKEIVDEARTALEFCIEIGCDGKRLEKLVDELGFPKETIEIIETIHRLKILGEPRWLSKDT